MLRKVDTWEGGSGLYPKWMQLCTCLSLLIRRHKALAPMNLWAKDPRGCYCRKRKGILNFQCLAAA